MIHTKENFFNNAASEIKKQYFPNEVHGYTQNENYHKTNYALELFNNGCLTYRQLIGRLAKSCNETTKNIHAIIEKHIISFGSYKYTPKK
jgi:hypothetical protein